MQIPSLRSDSHSSVPHQVAPVSQFMEGDMPNNLVARGYRETRRSSALASPPSNEVFVPPWAISPQTLILLIQILQASNNAPTSLARSLDRA